MTMAIAGRRKAAAIAIVLSKLTGGYAAASFAGETGVAQHGGLD
jgi:hypothetical protein